MLQLLCMTCLAAGLSHCSDKATLSQPLQARASSICLQGRICIGYTDLPSRLATQSSTLYSNNISKFLLSMGPFTGHKGQFCIDPKDDAVQGALILESGQMKWPAPQLKVRGAMVCRSA